MSDWQTTDSAPDDEIVMTKIDDGTGVRNEQPLKRRRNLWWFADDSMYCYYRPTHWRPLSSAERQKQGDLLRARAIQTRGEAERLDAIAAKVQP